MFVVLAKDDTKPMRGPPPPPVAYIEEIVSTGPLESTESCPAPPESWAKGDTCPGNRPPPLVEPGAETIIFSRFESIRIQGLLPQRNSYNERLAGVRTSLT